MDLIVDEGYLTLFVEKIAKKAYVVINVLPPSRGSNTLITT